jgi:TorA maturation chaperone TorD
MAGWAGGAAIATARRGIYRTFAKAMMPPDDGTIETLRTAAAHLEGHDLNRFAFYPHWIDFRIALDDAPTGDTLSAHYVRLFASGVDGALCPPVESWYRADARTGTAGALVSAVAADYGSLGFSAVNGAEPADHAATELEAMSLLCAQEADAWSNGQHPLAADALERQDRFLRTHLATWFGDFATDVAKADDGWYRAVTGAIDAYVIQEVDLVRAMRRQMGSP